MNIKSDQIEAIIFDLGGVILNIDINGPFQKLKELGIGLENDGMHIIKNNDIFKSFEIGQISPDEFRNQLHNISLNGFCFEKFDEIWNSIILDYPEENIRFLKKIKTKYRTFLMSNTNIIHYEYYTKILKDKFGYSNLDELFEKTYFSYSSMMRKPQQEFFEHIVRENNLIPNRTLFVDDFIENIEAAEQLGLKTFHITNGKKIFNIPLI
jgi:putative hydrolase of the HAD superfamily